MALRNFCAWRGAGRFQWRSWGPLATVFLFCVVWFAGCVTPSVQESVVAPGQPGQDSSLAKAASAGAVRPLLWEIRSPAGGAHASYLFGTIHVGVPTEDLPGVVWEKFRKAGTLVIEVDPEALKKESHDPHTLLLDQGKSLPAMLGKEDWGKLVALLDDAVAPEMLAQMKPHVVVSLALIRLFPSAQGMDFVFSERAADLKKTIVGLETYSFQEDLLSKVLDVEMLRKVIENYDALRGEAAGLVKIYRSGDETELSAFLAHTSLAGMPLDEHSRQELIVRRNSSWVRQLRELIRKEDLFIAVGAGHLPGNDGLIALLQKEGFVVQRVP